MNNELALPPPHAEARAIALAENPAESLQHWEAAGQFVDECEAAAVIPRSYADIKEPKQRRGSMIVAIMKGRELGMPPLEALQSIYVVNGIPTMYGDAIVRYVMQTGQLASIEEWFEGQPGANDRVAFVRVSRKGITGFITRKFSVADAQAQRLLGKVGPWQHSRDRMLMIRARTYAYRDLFADALRGVGVREEQEDLAHTLGIVAERSGRLIDPLADEPAPAQIESTPPAAGAPAEADTPADGVAEANPDASSVGTEAAGEGVQPPPAASAFRFCISTPTAGTRATFDGEVWSCALAAMFDKCADAENQQDADVLWRLNEAHIDAARDAGFAGWTARIERAARRCGIEV